MKRVTVRDITDFRDHLRRDDGQAVATVNRALVTLRRFFGWLRRQGTRSGEPGQVGEGTSTAAVGTEGTGSEQVRRLLREVELRQDIRAVPSSRLMLYTGCRVGDLVESRTERPDARRSERHRRLPTRQGQQATISSFAAPGPACPSSVARRSAVSRFVIRLRRRTRAADRSRRPGAVRQVLGDLRVQAASALVAAHDGPSISRRQRERPRVAGPDSWATRT